MTRGRDPLSEEEIKDVASNDWIQRDDSPILAKVAQTEPFKRQDGAQPKPVREREDTSEKRGKNVKEEVVDSQGAVHQSSQGRDNDELVDGVNRAW